MLLLEEMSLICSCWDKVPDFRGPGSRPMHAAPVTCHQSFECPGAVTANGLASRLGSEW